MTAQITDEFRYKGEEYSLIGIAGGELFEPEQYGMEPEMLHTACYRGFYAAYDITDDGIYLRQITMCEKDENYKAIDGVAPDIEEHQATYRDMDLLIPFTGAIRLATDFIEELYVHMGFQKPSAFETVLDFRFEEGKLMEVKDRSAEAKARRGAFKKKYEGVRGWGIEEAFSLDMDWMW